MYPRMKKLLRWKQIDTANDEYTRRARLPVKRFVLFITLRCKMLDNLSSDTHTRVNNSLNYLEQRIKYIMAVDY